MNEITAEELKEICTLTAELTKRRQLECSNLCIENFAPELFAKLLQELSFNKQGMVRYTRPEAGAALGGFHHASR